MTQRTAASIWSTALLLALAATAPAQKASSNVTTLHTSARLIPIAAVVKDKNGLPKDDLTRDDFILKQDSKEESIRYFSVAEQLPISFAVLVDVSASQSTMVADEVKASDIFFETMLQRPQDRAMLVQFDTTIQQLKGLTNQYSLLHLALSFVKSGAEAKNGTRVMDAVAGVTEKVLAKENGRKAIILITDGGDTDSRVSLKSTIEEAQKTNVAVYSICYRASDSGLTGAPSQVINAMADRSNDILRKLASETGGETFRVTRQMTLQKILAQIADGLNKQYEIGYIPPPDTTTNRFHKLELKVKDPHLKVQARTEFFAAP
ncbi:VWA domain-containing protein [Terriglobus sp. ADX1]|uniref:VWA domain-containing protein n=1 Tax=Terriglobus sp. ADX1 TaxID=2794063 RepID=UPI002FE601B5